MSKEQLVQEIKQIQRSDPNAKQAWWDYCDRVGDGIKDPNRHEIPFLRKYLSQVGGGGGGAGGRGPPPRGGGGGGRGPPAMASMGSMAAPWSFGGGGAQFAAAMGWGPPPAAAPGPAAGGMPLVEFVKSGQRHSAHWKSAWQSYCVLFGNGKYDPTKYDDAFLVSFIDYAGQVITADLTAQADERGVSLEHALQTKEQRAPKRPAPSSYAPPQQQRAPKRPNVGSQDAGGDDDPVKAELVSQVKEMQRSNPDAKQAWWTYCDEQLGGVKDPRRHGAEVLQAFIESMGS